MPITICQGLCWTCTGGIKSAEWFIIQRKTHLRRDTAVLTTLPLFAIDVFPFVDISYCKNIVRILQEVSWCKYSWLLWENSHAVTSAAESQFMKSPRTGLWFLVEMNNNMDEEFILSLCNQSPLVHWVDGGRECGFGSKIRRKIGFRIWLFVWKSQNVWIS